MIASVVVKLEFNTDANAVCERLQKRLGVECGDPVAEPGKPPHAIPVTLDATDRHQLEALHRWISDLPGVAFIDVVFTYLDDSDASAGNMSP